MVTTSNVTLQAYQNAERDMAHQRERTGLLIHSIITVLVSALVIVINVTLAPEFPWSPFPVVGMSIGLAAHWWFGYRRLDEQLRSQQQQTEARAAQLG
jgi:hypothetical protein